MNIFLSHLPLVPFIYGIVLAGAFFIYRWRWNRGDYGHIALSLTLLYVMFSMHGEAADTRMGAAIAVLTIDIVLMFKTLGARTSRRH